MGIAARAYQSKITLQNSLRLKKVACCHALDKTEVAGPEEVEMQVLE